VIFICCCCHISPEWVTAFGTIFLGIVAYRELSHIKKATKQYAFNAFIPEEKEFLKKGRIVENTTSDIESLLKTPLKDKKKQEDQIEKLIRKQEAEKEDFLNALDDFAFGVLNHNYFKEEFKATYQSYFEKVVSSYRNEIEINKCQNIISLVNLWGINF
jgi:hypothetical protein